MPAGNPAGMHPCAQLPQRVHNLWTSWRRRDRSRKAPGEESGRSGEVIPLYCEVE